MQVQLIDHTGFGHPDPARHAANVLVFTKNTRLEMKPGLFDEIASWPWGMVEKELAYMANTIPSSWEFITYTFLVTDVTRAFTHQFVRTRTGSFAQQTMRVLNVNGWGYEAGPTVAENPRAKQRYDATMDAIADNYDQMILDGAKIEDARGILPTNIHTNIVAKFDLRTIADTARKRASGRTQGEYRSVMEAMHSEVLRVHPWAKLFLGRTFDRAAHELENAVSQMCEGGQFDESQKIILVKLIDQLRATA